MPTSAHIVVLASARAQLPQLVDPLTQLGYQVHCCGDGAKALELALRHFPQLLVVDSDVPLLPAARLAQILRANPRTEGLSIFFVGREGEEIEGFQRLRDQFVLRPFNQEQLLLSIAAHFSRRDRSEQVSRQQEEVAGSLDQISLVDLLQVFGLNRKDGVLHLARGEERATVYILEGSVIEARSGRVSGEKAFFRLVRWESGKFWFTPGAPEVEARIAAPLDHLLMEGMRQNDEENAQRDQLPMPQTLLGLKVPRERLPRGLRPTTQEVLMLLEYFPRVEELLDHCPRPDFEVLQVLRVLRDKGLVEELRQAPAEAQLPLLTSAEVLAVKDFFNDGDVLLESASAKLVLLATAAEPVRQFIQALQGVAEFEPESEFLRSGESLPLGDIGRLAVGETFDLRLFCLPANAATAPLWTAFGRRLFGVAALGDAVSMAAAIQFFQNHLHVPVALLESGAAPTAETFVLHRNDRPALRRLLAFFAARFTGEAAPEELA